MLKILILLNIFCLIPLATSEYFQSCEKCANLVQQNDRANFTGLIQSTEKDDVCSFEYYTLINPVPCQIKSRKIFEEIKNSENLAEKCLELGYCK
ncbi:unnamed protein product [Caenorhabditis angaria]|uniref:Saposin B-type domain-containing protein n=1 Tax=Caenorhabditis angaria TaxID=860376 RepID=A0A9P1IRY4_9PELO|nr:unnamed protein product [Caenorhabditis angaria]